MRPKIKCECGLEVTGNTIVVHQKSQTCLASESFKLWTKEMVNKTKGIKYGWIKTEGQNAKIVSHCLTRILNCEIALENLIFENPRSVGVMTDSGRRKLSVDRLGDKNPQSEKNRYGIDFIINRVGIIGAKYVNQDRQWTISLCSWITKSLNIELPRWSLGLNLKDSKGRLKSKNRIVSSILEKHYPHLHRAISVIRGFLISKGQKASIKCLMAATESAIRNGKKRTTAPQLRLYDLIKHMDENALLEYRVKNKLFDIFSPKTNTLIEMHGRIWHDLEEAPKSLKASVGKNIENDKIKSKMAKDLGYNFWVFWDDQEADWPLQLTKAMESNETT